MEDGVLSEREVISHFTLLGDCYSSQDTRELKRKTLIHEKFSTFPVEYVRFNIYATPSRKVMHDIYSRFNERGKKYEWRWIVFQY